MAVDDFVFLGLAESHDALQEALTRTRHALDPILARAPLGEWPDLDLYVAMLDRVALVFVGDMPTWLCECADADQQELDWLEAMNPN